jgi:glycosyltransferase involved in cell wall biosynthesis
MAKMLAQRKHKVSMVSTGMSDSTKKLLKSYHINSVNLNVKLITRCGTSVSWFQSWAREAFLKLNSRRLLTNTSMVINFSNTIALPANFWYVQGPTTDFLNEMELPKHFKVGYRILRPLLTYVDNKLVTRIASISKLIVANSKFCASLYERRGIKVHKIIYPPLNCNLFRPTSKPSGNYVLTYFGKETRFDMLKEIGDMGVNMKAFGHKSPYIPNGLLKHKNIKFFGEVSDEELVNLYSNARFTLFTFTHEPFGYIPVESMACGTPVLTYNRHGPSETVINGVTGWLVNTDEEVKRLALSLWKNGCPSTIRIYARKRAMLFDVKTITKSWLQLIEKSIQS